MADMLNRVPGWLLVAWTYKDPRLFWALLAIGMLGVAWLNDVVTDPGVILFVMLCASLALRPARVKASRVGFAFVALVSAALACWKYPTHTTWHGVLTLMFGALAFRPGWRQAGTER